MPDRRDFLKLFGVGCSIIPIVGGAPLAAAEALLLESPKIEIAEKVPGQLRQISPKLRDTLKSGLMLDVTLRNPRTGEHVTFEQPTYITHCDVETVSIPSKSGYLIHAYRQAQLRWTLKGTLMPDADGTMNSLFMNQHQW